jgi:hypothetical protein
VEDSNKHIIDEILPQVGYLPKLYEDACSEKLKKKIKRLFTPSKNAPNLLLTRPEHWISDGAHCPRISLSDAQ